MKKLRSWSRLSKVVRKDEEIAGIQFTMPFRWTPELSMPIVDGLVKRGYNATRLCDIEKRETSIRVDFSMFVPENNKSKVWTVHWITSA